jgi:hypothetical protein
VESRTCDFSIRLSRQFKRQQKAIISGSEGSWLINFSLTAASSILRARLRRIISALGELSRSMALKGISGYRLHGIGNLLQAALNISSAALYSFRIVSPIL